MNEDISRSVMTVLSDLGIEARSYSGRGMYGASCIGVDCDHQSPFQVLAQLVIGLTQLADADDEASDHFTRDGAVQTDSMGRGSIVYFPRLPWLELCDCGDFNCEKSACQDEAPSSEPADELGMDRSAEHG